MVDVQATKFRESCGSGHLFGGAGGKSKCAETGTVRGRHRGRHAGEDADAVHQRRHRILGGVQGERVVSLDVDQQPCAVVGD